VWEDPDPDLYQTRFGSGTLMLMRKCKNLNITRTKIKDICWKLDMKTMAVKEEHYPTNDSNEIKNDDYLILLL
jgi:hypothetical protein